MQPTGLHAFKLLNSLSCQTDFFFFSPRYQTGRLLCLANRGEGEDTLHLLLRNESILGFLPYNSLKEKPDIAVYSKEHMVQLQNHLACAHLDKGQNKSSNTHTT